MIYMDYNEFYVVDIKPSRLGISQLINATSYLSKTLFIYLAMSIFSITCFDGETLACHSTS